MQGLQNLGATCAINSLVQIICRNKYLSKGVLESVSKQDTIGNDLKEIICLLQTQQNSISPKRFVSKLYSSFKNFFEIGEQIDIGELWTVLHDKLCLEYGMSIEPGEKKLPPEITLCDNKEMSQSRELSDYCDYTLDNINNHLTSKWQNTSQGILLNMIICSCCKKTLYNFEPFVSIPIDINETNVVAMFRQYLTPQTCQGDWFCDSCSERTKYTKMVKIWKMPRVLIFLIKRFNNHFSKNNTGIDINKDICIKKGSVLNNMSKDFNYELSSVALHYGNINNGHYCSICKQDDGYYMYDDLTVTKIHEDFCNRNKMAYIVVYSKI